MPGTRGLGRQIGSIRGRTVGVAVSVLGFTLIVGAVALVLFLRAGLTESIHADLELRAAEVVAELQRGTAPEDVRLPATDDLLVQVLDADGRVLAAGREAPSTPMVSGLGDEESATVTIGEDDDPFLVVAATVDAPVAARTVLAARVLDLVAESTEIVTLLLVLGLPLVLLLVGAVAWQLVGRSLAPVEAMRREVDAISAADLHRRVPDPPGSDEIRRLAETMNAMLARLEQASTRQRQLVADTSHELRSPIATIRQHAEVALAHPDGTTITDLAQIVLAENLRLARMVDDLLLLARADERSLGLTPRPLDIDDIVLATARTSRTSDGPSIDASAVSAGRVLGDPEALRRMVANLGENAVRHAQGRVALSVAEVGSEVLVRVDDDGPGIDPGDRQRAFERFVRLDAARARDDGGSGLGLAIVAELVAAHGGNVAIGESPMGGARVEVRLPRLAD
ncbi:MAG: ATP-binding protein [Candidatus Limnocylindria bacterium]